MYWYEISPFALAIIAIVISLVAQLNVNSTFNRYSKIKNLRGVTGAEIARRILDRHGLYDVNVERVSGKLSDHFDPRANVLRLSKGVYESGSVAAIGVAAHECGHAIQYAQEYAPMKLRGSLVKTVNFSSASSFLIILVGMLFSIPEIAYIGVALFSVIVFFQLVTLPVEFNASNRAVAVLAGGIMPPEELDGVKKVLTAAALTYVAAFVNSLLQLLRLLAIVNGGSGRRR